MDETLRCAQGDMARRLRSAGVAEELDVQPGAVAEAVFLAEAGDPGLSLGKFFAGHALGHEEDFLAVVGAEAFEEVLDFVHVFGAVNHELQLIVEAIHESPEHPEVDPPAIVPLGPAA